MAEFISSFITGFQSVVERDLVERLKGIKILNVFDGLIHYSYSGNSRDLEKIIYFNNTFFVLKTWKGKGLNFPSMVGAVGSEKKYYLINKGSFRVRFSKENQFSKVDKNIAKRAEETVLRNSRLEIDRVNPSTEIWYAIRSEGFGFCGQLISKREFTEKNLNKGELRPEIAYFICCYADLKKSVTDESDLPVILEPFCGYGSIPVQIAKNFKFSSLFVSDLDKAKIELVQEKKQLKDRTDIKVSVSNAFELKHLADKSVDIVITDPPWGFFEEIPDIEEFYENMFASFKSVLKSDGKMVVLSARKEEIEKTACKMNIKITDSLHTLVNGKKASLYKMEF